MWQTEPGSMADESKIDGFSQPLNVGHHAIQQTGDN